MKACARKWQTAAMRDGRLRGKDRESAERHRETCQECAREARELDALSGALAQLPTLTRDPINVHRTRQQLLGAFNQSLLEPSAPRVQSRALLAFAGAAALLGVLWLVAARKPVSKAPQSDTASVVHVHASPGARWTEHLDARLDRIELSAGSASFEVRAHPGRRVIVSLPDGQIEDLGTVFAVFVQDQRTQRVTVSEGRVSLRLLGRADTIIGPGESWEAPAPPAARAEAEPSTTPPAASKTSSGSPTRERRAGAASAAPRSAMPAPRAESNQTAPASTSAPESAQAEDDSYLRIVLLLRTGKQDEARAEAKRYLLLFPSGFRRVEVLNIATR